MRDYVYIGITGPFGSGCTTAAKILKEKFEFGMYSLSDYLYKSWEDETGEKREDADKTQLQKLGDDLREERGNSILAKKVYEKSKQYIGKKSLVFDSIRNLEEIQFLREKFPDFFLIAIFADEKDRWERLKIQYAKKGKTYTDFEEEDKRDRNEESFDYGQQVMFCVDDADVLIWNENKPMESSESVFEKKLERTLEGYISLFKGNCREPTHTESYMNLAYSAALMSNCLKRQVGAIILDENDDVISVGYNQNPTPLKPCHEEFDNCHRDIYVKDLISKFNACPLCGGELKKLPPPYECPKCTKNLYREVVKDKAMSRCTALHAEEKAIINARQNLKGCTLYVTTFPCFTCAQKILGAGIKTIYYTEVYTDKDSIDLLKKNEIRLVRFSGVKARAYFRLFNNWRREKEKDIKEKEKNRR